MRNPTNIWRERIREAYAWYDKLSVVHYASARFDETKGEPTPIYYIIVKRLVDGHIYTFDGRDADEFRMFHRGFARYVEHHDDHLFLHWNMRNERYGFEALDLRYRYLLGWAEWMSLNVPLPNQRLDLGAAMDAIHGHEYAQHPRLPNLAQLNGLNREGWLDRGADAQARANGQWWRIRDDALRKVEWIEALFRLEAEGALCTASGHEAEPAQIEAAGEAERKGGGDEQPLGKEARALAVLAEHPEWRDQDIAKAVGCHRSTLYRWKKFRFAREKSKEARSDLPTGAKDADGNLEAW